MLRVRIAIADRQTSMAPDRARLRRAVRAALAGNVSGTAQISLALVDDPTMARLHERFLGHKGPTDVLSFLLEQSADGIEAEVVVDTDVARREAPRYGWPAEHELLLYVIHGTLHLAGYDDRTAAGRKRMKAREEEVLAGLGVTPVITRKSTRVSPSRSDD